MFIWVVNDVCPRGCAFGKGAWLEMDIETHSI